MEMSKIIEKCHVFHFLASFDGNGAIFDVAAVLRVVDSLIDEPPVIAGLDVRRDIFAGRLTDVAGIVCVFVAVLPIARFPMTELDADTAFPMPDTALRTMANFDVTVAAAGRSTLFGRDDVFNRVVSTGDGTAVFDAVRLIPILPRLARRFIGRAKIFNI